MSRRRWSGSELRWPKSAKPTTLCASSATPSARSFSRARRRPDADRFRRGGRHDRHGCRPNTRSPSSNLGLWSRQQDSKTVEICGPEKIRGRYYLRFLVDDEPGVLAEITGELGKNGVSIASVIQHEPESDGQSIRVPLVIMTHAATEGAMDAAMAGIDELGCVTSDGVRLRVLN
jgi:hypothetical protein